MKNRLFPALPLWRIALSLGIVISGAVFATTLYSPIERTIATVAFGLLAIISMLEIGTASRKNPTANAPILRDTQSTLSNHPDIGQLIDGLNDPVLLTSGNTVKLANRAAKKLLGQHIVGEDVRLVIRHPTAAELILQPDSFPADRPLQLVGIGSRDQRWELYLQQLSDSERAIYLWDRSGIYAVEKMRTDFVANASHELRTPLSSIKGFIETLEENEAGDNPEVRARFLSVMFNEANRMQKLIDDLISLSRIEADKFTLPETKVDLPGLMEEVHLVLCQGGDMRANDIVLKIEAGSQTVRGDRTQLSQLLHNLVGNSMKYGHKDTPITMGLVQSRNGTMLRLTVQDEGEGIAPEHLPRLTERFYRVDSGRSRALGGTGLGLSIVKHVVERHRGRLEIDSEPMKGTRITISLPVSPPVESAPANRDASALAE